MEKMRELRASALVFDFNLYPRHRIDSYHVRSMAESLRAGSQLPPVLVDRKSKRVVDGFHRVEAHRNVYGPQAKVPVIFRSWPSEKEMLLEAIRLNATHGRTLSPYDKARCLALAEARGLKPEQVAAALSMTPEKVGEIKAGRLATFHLEPVALKASSAHLAGKDLSEEEQEYNIKAGGLHQTFYINQVIALLEKRAVDWENPQVAAALRRLQELLSQALAPA